jgi:Predicted AAA-ATPase
MEPLRILPIGVQTFKNMRENNYVYVDKTQHIHRLVTHQKTYFLSRPRRFGKSLLLSTLKELYEGNRTLFKDLWIEDKWDWSKKSPVIHVSFANMGFKTEGLENAIHYELNELARHHNIIFQGAAFNIRFRELIQGLFEQHGKVVILIDEYDKPIIEYLEKGSMDKAKENQGILKTFYSVLKDAENSIEFLFITGVSKFAKVSIFSDLNHLTDITLNKNYATITGYTQAELESNFEDYIQLAMQDLQLSREGLLAEMKKWYDGFSWDGKNFLYNPFGTLNFLDNRAFRNYWYATGTPTFLVKLMRKQESFEFENQEVTDSFIDKCDLDNLDVVSVMFQTGYLTVKTLDPMTGIMRLDYPNQEVRDSTYQFVITPQ